MQQNYKIKFVTKSFTINLIPRFLSFWLSSHSPVPIGEGTVVPMQGLKVYVGRDV